MEEIERHFRYRAWIDFWCGLVGIQSYEIRDRLWKFNSTLSFYIYNESNKPHHRLHCHAKINNVKVATIYLDTLEVDFLSSKIKKSDEKTIKNWVEKNSKALQEICKKNDGKFEIPFWQSEY